MDYGYRYNYEYNYPVRNSGESAFEAIMAIYLIVLTLVVIFALVSYIFHSIGLYTIGKRMGREYPWLAFIPFARNYFQGELVGEIRLKNKKISNLGIWNMLILISSSVLRGVFLPLILSVTGFGVVSEVTRNRGVGIVVVLVALLYTLMITAAIVLAAARKALTVLINEQILERFTTRNMATVHAVLTIAVPLYEAFCFFVMRTREFNPGMEPKQTPPPALIPPIYPGSPEPPVHSGGPEPSVHPVSPKPPVHSGGPEPSVHPVSPEPPVHPGSPKPPVHPGGPEPSGHSDSPESPVHPGGPEPSVHSGSPEPPEKPETLYSTDVPEQPVQPLSAEDLIDHTEPIEERDEPQKTE